jgi:ribosomal protein S18 acetylase RimI-like enzyme
VIAQRLFCYPQPVIHFITDASSVSPNQLDGFFDGWPDPPAPERHIEILKGSSHVVLAVDEDKVVGIVTAVSDGVLAAYIPLLEVIPAYRSRGIGSELVQRMRDLLSNFYMVDVICDAGVQPFYESLGFDRATGAMTRNYTVQSGRPGELAVRTYK